VQFSGAVSQPTGMVRGVEDYNTPVSQFSVVGEGIATLTPSSKAQGRHRGLMVIKNRRFFGCENISLKTLLSAPRNNCDKCK